MPPRAAVPRRPPRSVLPQAKIKQSVRVGVNRGDSGEVRLTAESDKDIVVLHIVGGPSLHLHPKNARNLLRAQATPAGPRGVAGLSNTPGANEVRVTPQLRWRGLENQPLTRGGARGLAGDVILESIDVLTGAAADGAFASPVASASTAPPR